MLHLFVRYAMLSTFSALAFTAFGNPAYSNGNTLVGLVIRDKKTRAL